MKVLSYIERDDGYIEFTTDYAPEPVFVYESDKFNNLKDLEKEIKKKIKEIEKRNTLTKAKKDKVKSDIDA